MRGETIFQFPIPQISEDSRILGVFSFQFCTRFDILGFNTSGVMRVVISWLDGIGVSCIRPLYNEFSTATKYLNIVIRN